MGLFGKKKDESSSGISTGNYVAPTPQPDPVDDVHTDVEAPVEPGSPSPAPQLSDIESTRAQSLDHTYNTTRDHSFGTVLTKDSAFTITRKGQLLLDLNGFENGHLMRWKFASEQGPAIIRLPALFLATGIIFATIYQVVATYTAWNLSDIILSIHSVLLALLVVIMEARITGYRDDEDRRGGLRTFMTRYFNGLRLLWGRGVLYVFVGTLNLAVDHPYILYTAIPLAILGLIAIIMGAHASYNLDKVKSSLSDEAYLWHKFDYHDTDNQNKIDLGEFTQLLWDLGLEFDSIYTERAFSQISSSSDGKVSFDDFRAWWVASQNDGKALQNSAML